MSRQCFYTVLEVVMVFLILLSADQIQHWFVRGCALGACLAMRDAVIARKEGRAAE